MSTSSPTDVAPKHKGPVSNLVGALVLPWRLAGRSVAAVVTYPVRNLGKHMPMG